MISLVTGAGGFIGGFLVEHLAAQGHEVHALDQSPGSAVCAFHRADILDPASLTELVGKIRPSAVFHLAAQSYPGISWQDPAATFRVNVLGTIHVLEAIRRSGLKPVTVVACSSAEYSSRAGTGRIAEDAPLDPSSPYGISKLAEDHAAKLYGERYGIPVIRMRPFFLVGTRKKGDVCSDFARGVVAVEQGRQADVPVGNLDVVRDLLDVRDGVEAMALLAERGAKGEVYNICSGTGYSLRDVLETYKSLARVPVRERVDPARLRPIEEMERIGDPSKLKALGWAPRHAIRDTLGDILDFWRTADAAGGG